MPIRLTPIGNLTHDIPDLATTYQTLAEHDEQVGRWLIDQGHYRHAVHLLLHAMEQFVRSAIFCLVNPEHPYFRQRTMTHGLDQLLEFLLEISCTDSVQRTQVWRQLQDHVVGGITFANLPHALYTPTIDACDQTLTLLNVNRQDAERVLQRLQVLKRFLKDIHQHSFH